MKIDIYSTDMPLTIIVGSGVNRASLNSAKGPGRGGAPSPT